MNCCTMQSVQTLCPTWQLQWFVYNLPGIRDTEFRPVLLGDLNWQVYLGILQAIWGHSFALIAKGRWMSDYYVLGDINCK